MTTSSSDGPSALRIWHIAESYPPVYGGGAGIYVRDVCHALAALGHEVRVLSTGQWDAEPYAVRLDEDGPIQLRRVNLPYFRSKDPDGWELGLRKWRAHERRVVGVIEDALADWKPDLVVYSATRPLGEQCLITLGSHGLPIAGWLHEAWLICPRVMLLRSPTSEPCSGPARLKCLECMYSHYDGTHTRAALRIPRRALRIGPYFAYRTWRRARARRQVIGAAAYSDFMVETHREQLPGPVLRVPLGISLEGLDAEQPDRPRTPLRFGFMGGFQPNKGIWDILDAMQTLGSEGLDFELHVWGPGQEQADPELRERDLTDRVFMHGMYEGTGIWSAYNLIDVALIPTTVPEPFGRIPIEAAAAGAPTIGADVGGITESVSHDVNGLVHRFRDKDDLTRQMRRILVEPGLYERLQANLVPPADTRTIGPATENAYRALLASAGSGVMS